MVLVWGGNRSAWDFGNPKNWVINKSLEQNLNELYVGGQIMALALPEALAYKAAAEIQAGLGAKAASRAAIARGAAATTPASTGAASTAAAAGTAAAAIGLGTTAVKVGAGVYALDWLKDNWWIAAILLGGLIGLKMVK